MVIIDHGDDIDTFINDAGNDDGEKDNMTLGWAETFEEFAFDISRKVEHGWDLVLSRNSSAWCQIVISTLIVL